MSGKYSEELKANELLELTDDDIDTSDIPELTPDFFRNAKLLDPQPKKQLTVRMDADVIDWFKAQGKGYQSRMNAVLRAYVESVRAK